MKNPKLMIRALGMASSLGCNPTTACAAARAGLVRVRPLPYSTTDPETREEIGVSGHTVGDFTKGFSDLGLWVRLANLALPSLFADAGMKASELSQMPVLINLPSGALKRSILATTSNDTNLLDSVGFKHLRPWYESTFLPKVAQSLGIPSLHGRINFGDETGFVALFQQAADLIYNGCSEQVCIGTIGATTDPSTVRATAELQRLKTILNPVGAMPGEAAVFMIVTAPKTTSLFRCRPRAQVCRWTLVDDPDLIQGGPPIGRGYSLAIIEALANPSINIRKLYVDLNGEEEKAKDWGNATTRLSESLKSFQTTLPMASFGNVSAAYGGIATALCTHMFERDSAWRTSVLIAAGADSGKRAACILEPTPI